MYLHHCRRERPLTVQHFFEKLFVYAPIMQIYFNQLIIETWGYRSVRSKVTPSISNFGLQGISFCYFWVVWVLLVSILLFFYCIPLGFVSLFYTNINTHTACMRVVVSLLCSCVSSSVGFDSGVANWQHVGIVAPVCPLVFSLLPWRLHAGQGVCVNVSPWGCVCFTSPAERAEKLCMF